MCQFIWESGRNRENMKGKKKRYDQNDWERVWAQLWAVWHAGNEVGSGEKMDGWRAGTQPEELGQEVELAWYETQTQKYEVREPPLAQLAPTLLLCFHLGLRTTAWKDLKRSHSRCMISHTGKPCSDGSVPFPSTFSFCCNEIFRLYLELVTSVC